MELQDTVTALKAEVTLRTRDAELAQQKVAEETGMFLSTKGQYDALLVAGQTCGQLLNIERATNRFHRADG